MPRSEAPAIPRKRKNDSVAYLFLLPSMLIFILFVCWPLLQTVYLSFQNWNGLGPIEFVGLKNYRQMMADPIVLQSLKNNIIWLVTYCTVPIAIGILQASLIINSGIRHANIFQLILFLPQVFSSVVVTVIWSWIYNPAIGPLNTALRMLGLDRWALAWTGDPRTVVIALLVMNVWVAYGFNTVVYSAAIQGIDTQLYEAATLDGCGVIRRFLHITIPCVRRTSTTLVLFAMIDSFRVFDIVFQMTKGGPGYASHVLSYYLYSEAFMKNRIGYGSSIAVVLTVVVLLASRGFLFARERGERA